MLDASAYQHIYLIIKCVSKVLGHFLKASSAHICPRTFETHFTYLTKQCSALNVAFSHAIKSPPFKLGRVQIAASRIIVFPYSRKIRISHEMNVNFLFSSCGD